MATIGEFSARFDEVYDVLYNAGGLIDYGYAVERHEQMVRIRPDYANKLKELSEYRHDLIVSDRECAAFCVAYFWEG